MLSSAEKASGGNSAGTLGTVVQIAPPSRAAEFLDKLLPWIDTDEPCSADSMNTAPPSLPAELFCIWQSMIVKLFSWAPFRS